MPIALANWRQANLVVGEFAPFFQVKHGRGNLLLVYWVSEPACRIDVAEVTELTLAYIFRELLSVWHTSSEILAHLV